MRNLTIRLSVSFLAFLIGIAVTVLWSGRSVRLPEELPTTKSPVVDLGVRPPHVPERWQKIDDGGGFSFYLPPDMIRGKIVGDHRGTAGIFNGKMLTVYYVYGERVECSPDDAHASLAAYESKQVVIAGKRAWLNDSESEEFTGQSSPMKWPWMTLCFPDIGDGKTRLYWQVSSPYPSRLNEIKQAFNSIEFR